MTTKFFKVAACVAMLAATQGIQAQNLMEDATIHTLGDAKTWTKGEGDDLTETTFDVEALNKALNTENNKMIYLFPEGGYDTEANREIGIQGFYVDLGAVKNIGTIETYWEGAAASAYSIYLTQTEPTLAILDTEATYSAEDLGQYTHNVAVLPDNSKGRYVVFQPTDATNYGWGVKLFHISAYAPQEDELTFFSVEPAFIFEDDTEVNFTFRNQLGLPIDGDKVTVTCDHGTYEDGKLTLEEGETATFTATMGDESLTFTVSHPNAPKAPEDVKTAIYTKDQLNVQWEIIYNRPAGEEPTVNWGKHEFENGEWASHFHAVYCVFFHNEDTMPVDEYGVWNNLNIENPAETLGKYLNIEVYSSRPSHCAISFNDGTPDQFKFTLPHDDWSSLSVDMSDVDNMKNMSIRFPEESDLDCVLLANIYFSDEAAGNLPEEDVDPEDPDIETGIESVAAQNETVDVFNVAGVLVKSNVKKAEALEGLGKGLYIVGGKKVVK